VRSSSSSGLNYIPNNTEFIASGAFNISASYVSSITIPSKVLYIGDNAFYFSSGYTSSTLTVTIKAIEPPVIGSNVFNIGYGRAFSILVPYASVNAYKTAWSSYSNYISGANI